MLAYQIQNMAFNKFVLLFKTIPQSLKINKQIIYISHSSLEIEHTNFISTYGRFQNL